MRSLTILLLLMLGGTTQVSAVTIDFELGVPGCSMFPGTTQGFTFIGAGDPPALVVCDNPSDPSFASNGSSFLFSGAEPISGQAPIAMLEGSGGGAGLPFSLLAFDATELAVATPGGAVRVTGYDATLTNIIADVSFVFDGLIDGPGGVEDFETFLLPSSFQHVWGVAFEGVDLGSGTRYYAIDNVVATVVPVPGAFWLLITGLLGLAGMNKMGRYPEE